MDKIKNISGIDTNTVEGRLLIAAISVLQVHEPKFNDRDILDLLHENAEQKFPLPIPAAQKPGDFIEELRRLLNAKSIDAQSDTPDNVLAIFIIKCLNAFNEANHSRKR